jgi:hypothetical protein
MFFATCDDIKGIIQEVENSISLTYYTAGMLDAGEEKKYDSLDQVERLGFTSKGDWNYNRTFLILRTGTEFQKRVVPQKNGGVKFAIDQKENPLSIMISIGGIVENEPNVMIPWKIGTISNNEVSNELYALFVNKVKKKFKKVDVFYLGKIAENNLANGWRLVTNVKLSKEFDLRVA